MIYWPSKPAANIRTYGLDWTPLLSKIGDPTITGSAWAVLSGSAIVTAPQTVDPNGKIVYTRVSGGTANASTTIRNTVTLSNGQVWSCDVVLKVRA